MLEIVVLFLCTIVFVNLAPKVWIKYLKYKKEYNRLISEFEAEVEDESIHERASR